MRNTFINLFRKLTMKSKKKVAAEKVAVEEVKVEQDQLNAFVYFPTVIYTIDKQEFLAGARKAAKRALDVRKKEHKLDSIYPVYQTGNLFDEPEMQEFSQYVGQTAWNILSEQGYHMDNLNTYFTEMWCQEHHKGSLMEQHTHGNGNQIVGFYFLDVPLNSSRLILHDPRPGKIQMDLVEQARFAKATESVYTKYQDYFTPGLVSSIKNS